MDLKTILNLVTNPLVVGALGSYLSRERFGKKYGNVLSMAGGAVAGAVAGSLVQTYLLGVGATPPPAPPPVEGYGLPPQHVALNFAPRTQALPAHAPAVQAPGPQHYPAAEGVFDGTSYDTADGAVADAAAAEFNGNGSGGGDEFN